MADWKKTGLTLSAIALAGSTAAYAIGGVIILPDRTLVKNCSVQVRDGSNKETAYCDGSGEFSLRSQPSASAVVLIRSGIAGTREIQLPGSYFDIEDQVIVLPYVSSAEDPYEKNRAERVEAYKEAAKNKNFEKLEDGKLSPEDLYNRKEKAAKEKIKAAKESGTKKASPKSRELQEIEAEMSRLFSGDRPTTREGIAEFDRKYQKILQRMK